MVQPQLWRAMVVDFYWFLPVEIYIFRLLDPTTEAISRMRLVDMHYLEMTNRYCSTSPFIGFQSTTTKSLNEHCFVPKGSHLLFTSTKTQIFVGARLIILLRAMHLTWFPNWEKYLLCPQCPNYIHEFECKRLIVHVPVPALNATAEGEQIGIFHPLNW